MRGAIAAILGVPIVVGSSLLLRSRADWSLDLPVNATAASFALLMLMVYAVTIGLRAHHVAVWGALLVAGLLPVWDRRRSRATSASSSPGVATIVAGVLDHRLLVRTLGPPKALRPRARQCRSVRGELLLDRLIHEPGRLAILTVLSSVDAADFVFLQRATGLTKGNLSSHLSKLEDAGLVEIEKRFIRKKPNTNVALTAVGRRRIAEHWDQLERLKGLARSAVAEES